MKNRPSYFFLDLSGVGIDQCLGWLDIKRCYTNKNIVFHVQRRTLSTDMMVVWQIVSQSVSTVFDHNIFNNRQCNL